MRGNSQPSDGSSTLPVPHLRLAGGNHRGGEIADPGGGDPSLDPSTELVPAEAHYLDRGSRRQQRVREIAGGFAVRGRQLGRVDPVDAYTCVDRQVEPDVELDVDRVTVVHEIDDAGIWPELRHPTIIADWDERINDEAPLRGLRFSRPVSRILSRGIIPLGSYPGPGRATSWRAPFPLYRVGVRQTPPRPDAGGPLSYPFHPIDRGF